MKPLSKVYTALIFVILYAPIAVMVLFSFNSINATGVFAGFSTLLVPGAVSRRRDAWPR